MAYSRLRPCINPKSAHGHARNWPSCMKPCTGMTPLSLLMFQGTFWCHQFQFSYQRFLYGIGEWKIMLISTSTLRSDGVILLFHLNTFCVFKEIKSYFKSYSLQIQNKWAIVNSLPFTSLGDPSWTHEGRIQFFSPSLVSNFLHVSSFQFFP